MFCRKSQMLNNYLPCDDVRGSVEDFIAGFGGFESTAES